MAWWQEHGKGCTCETGKPWDDCPWEGSRAEVDSIPTSFLRCSVCYALTDDDMDLYRHMQWHEKLGHLDG